MGPGSQFVRSNDLGREKTKQWMVWIRCDGVEEGVIGTITDFTEARLFGGIIPGLDASSQERLEAVFGVGTGEAPPGGRGIRQLGEHCCLEY